MPRTSALTDALVSQVTPEHRAAFHGPLARWFEAHRRPMPWREPGPDGRRDPYRVWVSEVMLQQTRVDTALPYFLRFTEAFPTPEALAAAPLDSVLKRWEGLGYYSRARNLHRAAQEVVRDHDGIFPTDYAALLTLPGVGPYSAAAVASFASNEDVAVVDGNVYRVLARIFGVSEPIDTPAGQRVFRGLADELLPRGRAGAYNQAIMDFGATVCTPKRPRCPSCPLRDSCSALSQNRVDVLPRKAGTVKRRTRYFDYLRIADARGRLWVRRRGGGDIWQGLYDLPLVEGATGFAERPQLEERLRQAGIADVELLGRSQPRKHVLSHQELRARFWSFALRQNRGDAPDLSALADGAGKWVRADELLGMGIPQLLHRYLTEPNGTFDFGGAA